MAAKSNPERLPTELDPEPSTTPEVTPLIQDMGKATKRTMGFGGIHFEFGTPPFNNQF